MDEEIKHLMAMTQAPEYYPVLVELSTVSSILSLLTHENMDIAIDAIELLKELTDEEVLEVGMDDEEGSSTEAVEGMKVFVNALLEQGLLDLLVQNMSRLDEEEANDRLGVFNTLAILENLTGIDVALAETIVQKSTFLPWIMKRLKVKTFDSNKQYCSEILSILLQSSSGTGSCLFIFIRSHLNFWTLLSSWHYMISDLFLSLGHNRQQKKTGRIGRH